ncbi:hypothetical protein [Nocardia rhamnosiphila]|uniref:Uncharacterized protein n=1 Tax=Nocardia rhamnosiphila TaxID=426716 RepID=A0ABV2WRQ2_9NOCA
MQGVPAVLVDRGAPRPDRCSGSVDDVLGGRPAAQHLLDTAHTRIEFVGGPMTITQPADRHRGATDAIAAAGAQLETIPTTALTFRRGVLVRGQGGDEPVCSCAARTIRVRPRSACPVPPPSEPGEHQWVGLGGIVPE